jgi:serine/threonine protein kinase
MNDISQKYEIVREIDEGAFGAVLLAISKTNGAEVAIKRMKKKVRSWAECTELREVKVLDKVKHPNVVKLLEVLKINDELFLIFEYVHTNLYKLYLSFRQRVKPHYLE